MTYINEVCKAFNKAAHSYEAHALIEQEIGDRLFERLDYLKIEPRYVLDLACGTGLLSKRLAKRFPKALIIGLDIATQMLKAAKAKQGWLRPSWALVEADMHQLPFIDGSFDLIFTNQALHYTQNMPHIINEMNRVLKPGACLMFSSLGPDTGHEIKNAWSEIDTYTHVNQYADMHDLGDLLLSSQFLDPVVDMEMLSIHYSSVQALVTALKAQGSRLTDPKRRKGLSTPATWSSFEHNYEKLCKENKYPLSYEVVYGHAWKGVPRQIRQGNETHISLAQVRASIKR